MTARSWSSSTPIASCPCGECAWLCRVNSLMTIAVLESATKMPSTTSRRNPDSPRATAMAITTAAVTTICAAPPKTTRAHVRRSPVTEKSSPAVKSSKAMPISASTSTSACVPTTRSPAGPVMMPERIKRDNRRHPETAGDQQQRQRGGVDDDEFLEQGAVGHRVSRGRVDRSLCGACPNCNRSPSGCGHRRRDEFFGRG